MHQWSVLLVLVYALIVMTGFVYVRTVLVRVRVIHNIIRGTSAIDSVAVGMIMRI